MDSAITQKGDLESLPLCELSCQDSNLERQNQNLLCYNFITIARMKQWLMILALCWAAATVNAAGESQSRTLRAEITAAVLSQADSERFETDNAPLLATACTGCTQLSGAEQGAGRSVRHAENFIVAGTRGYACAGNPHPAAPAVGKCGVRPPSIRRADRYIYYLRRIII